MILPGAVDVEAGNCPIDLCGQHRNQAGGAVRERPLRTGHRHGGTFTATGPLEAALEGAGQGVIGTGTDETDLLIIGGACTTPTPSLQSVVIGSTQATTTCGNANFTNDYSELYNQSSNTWSVGPTFATGFAPTNGAASAVLP